MPNEARAPFLSLPDLEETLAMLAAAGREAWPDVRLADKEFMAFLGRVLPGTPVAGLTSLRSDDLWLACGYGLGHPVAIEALERLGFASISQTLGRLGATDAVIEDLLQELRSRVIEMHDPRSTRKHYAGRGELIGWLRVMAVREFHHQRFRTTRELQLDATITPDEPPPGGPELLLLLQMHKQELTDAFQRALASLSSRERNILRYYFVEELSIDQIGVLYGVHRSTAARWVIQAREMLSTRTQDLFRATISISDEGFQRILGLIESRIGVELAGIGATATS